MTHHRWTFAIALVLALGAGNAFGQWAPAQGPLSTRWAQDVSPENTHAEYPRPQMVRPEWQNLNGLWDYAIESDSNGRPQTFDGKILVPFPLESALSGVRKHVKENDALWYRRTFTVPRGWSDKRVLLNFGAVDWHAMVYVNGTLVGEHRGGYDPFTFDITEALKGGQEELLVAVRDPTDRSFQPRGKQVLDPKGIYYTASTGIWQTVWLEPVSKSYIEGLRITPDADNGSVRVEVVIKGDRPRAHVEAYDGEKRVASASGSDVVLKIPEAKLWSPESPFLYGLKVRLSSWGKELDAVDSYFGIRKISLGKDDAGITRIMLNNQFVFQYGPLDQGFWPDGLYTAPTDEALVYDVQVIKKIGCNMLRKHVKVEPSRYYYHCDRLGILVWQDMPSGDRSISADQPDIVRAPESAANFEREWSRIISANYNHPCIVMWVPFNEGWGQYDTGRIVELTRKLDPTRLVNSASGWTDRGVGDVRDIHSYPGPAMPKPEPARAVVLGEFGGLGLPVEGHTWLSKGNWGYKSFETADQLTTAYLGLIKNLRPMIDQGLSAAVYTQTTDVEIEVNGWMTYDRAMLKMPESTTTQAHRELFRSPVVATKKEAP